MRTYGILKSEVREEPYLRTVRNVKDRISMTKFRLSNHTLMIEKGRHQNLERHDRICPLCPLVEDEIHFLTKCVAYRYIRRDLLAEVEQVTKIRNIKYMEEKTLFKILLEREDIAEIVAKYLKKSMELRDFLMENHRQFI